MRGVTPSALVEPAYFTHPPYEYTFGPEVADLGAMAGFPPDPEQALALDVLFGVGANGRSAVFEFANICGRQNMKTGLFKLAVLGWVFVTEQWLTVWSAHEMDTTREAFTDLVNLIEGCAPLCRRLAPGPTNGIYRGNGTESIQFKTGQRIKFKARTHAGGRGLTGDRVILDEALKLKASHMGSLLPTLSARPDPQVVYGSSAALAESEVLRRIVARGRAGTSPRLGYMEFCAPEGSCASDVCSHEVGSQGCALDDMEMVRRANPALERRITIEYIRSEREALPLEEYMRERMGWHEKGAGEGAGRIVDMERWGSMQEDRPALAPKTPIALGVDMTADQKWVTIAAAAWTAERRLRLEVGVHEAPSQRVVDRIMDLIARWDPCCLVINGSSPAKSLVPDLKTLGIDPEMMSASQNAEACGGFYLDAVERKLSHADDPRLTEALAGAEKRILQGGAWVVDYTSPVVLSPLQSAICARWGLMTYGVDVRPHQMPQMDESTSAASSSDELDLMTASF